jgi:hypothetical protein
MKYLFQIILLTVLTVIGNYGKGQNLKRIDINGKWGFIDATGKEIVPCKYDKVWEFERGFAHVELNGKQGYIDTTSKEVIPVQYDYAFLPSSGGLALVSVGGEYRLFYYGGKYGFVDTTGKEIVPLKYDNAWYFSGGITQSSRVNII